MKSFISFAILFTGLVLHGQTVEPEKDLRKQNTDTVQGWKKSAVINIGISQSSFTNWSAGGLNSISANGLLSVAANYKSEKSAWDNSLDLGYGILQQGKSNSYIKTDDKIDFNTKYGRVASKSWYYSALVNFKTQFTDGYNYPNDSVIISRFLAPGYLVAAVGMDYKPNDIFGVFIAPFTSKSTFVNDQTLANNGAFGVDKAEYNSLGGITKLGKMYRSEFGGYLKMIFKKDLMKNVMFQTKLDLFSNYLNNPGNIDVNWENLLVLKVNKFISASISTALIYDDDIDINIDANNDGIAEESGPRVQFKEVIQVGLSYKF